MKYAAYLIALLTALIAGSPAQGQDALPIGKIKLPPGFAISVFARVPEARSMVVVPERDAVFVGNRQGGRLFAAIDKDRNGHAERVLQLAGGLVMPNGLAWKDGHLYVAEMHRVFRVAIPSLDALASASAEILFDALPRKPWHGWRYIAFGPKGRLHIAVGSPCNICEAEGLEGRILRLEGGGPAGLHPVTVAKGVRNSVGFDFHPRTGQLYFTDNGADGMGDDVPADELNALPADGADFGFPFFGGGNTRTPEFARRPLPNDLVPPVVAFGAHVAPLGIHFYRGQQFPPAYRNDAFVAQHGSWNRSEPVGYRIMRIRMDDQGTVMGTEVFADGFLDGVQAWGRPVDIKELADGSLLASDDAGGAIYRIRYRGAQ